ncbi:hypothetical protein ACFL5I_01495 [Planctomycetota bacterium]
MVLAVLTLLCLLGLMFVMMANMERATARAYLDMVRAKMIAQSGIHAAMVNTRALLTEKGFNIEEMIYYGEDLDASGGETPSSNLENQDNEGILQTSDCPLYRAVRPSFMVDRNQDGQLDEQDLIEINREGSYGYGGNKVGVSGIMPGAYQPKAGTIGACYSVKVEDLSGKIFINGVEDSDERKMLKWVMGNLTKELFDKKWIGQVLAEQAPYANLDEINTKLAKQNIRQFTAQELILLKSCITTYAWRDTAVIKPVMLERRLGNECGIPPQVNKDIFVWRTIRPLSIGYPSQVDDSGNFQRIVGRAPVNINTAPEPVLVALLTGLAGLFLDETVGFKVMAHSGAFPAIKYSYLAGDQNLPRCGSLGCWKPTSEISLSQARQIARAIIENRDPEMVPDAAHPWRGPFRGWQQFGLFCDRVLVLGEDHGIPVDFLSSKQADVLKANFNPNTNLTELNPPAQRLFWIGKDNFWGYRKDKHGTLRLTETHSFEFSFFPTGYFLVTSLGRLLGPNQNVLAEAEIQATVQLFSLYRETSQKDFLEDFWTRKASIKEVINENSNPNLQLTTDNLTLQTYPEIIEYNPYQTGWCRGPDSSQSAHLQDPYVQDAHYDGYITLATVENRGTNPAPDFRLSYNKNGLDADIAPTMERKKCLKDTRGPYLNRLVGPAGLTFDERQTLKTQPGSLFPDGIYSELDGVPMYDYRPPDIDNFIVSMWLKPHFFPEASTRTRVYFTYQVWDIPMYYSGHTVGPTAPKGIYNIANRDYSSPIINNGEDYSAAGGYPDIYDAGWDHTAFSAGGYRNGYRNGYDSSANSASMTVSPALNHRLCGPDGYHSGYIREGQDWGQTPFRAGKWLHLLWRHQRTPQTYGSLFADGLYINNKGCVGDFYRCEASCSGDSDFTAARPLLRLGERREAEALNSVPDATLDEILIWENSTTQTLLSALENTWQPGRYYRENDGVFTSRTFNLAQHMGVPTNTPITVFMVNWTQYAPEEKYTLAGNPVVLPLPGEPGAPTCEIEILKGEVENPMDAEAIGVRKSTTIQPDPSGELIKGAGPYAGDILVVTEPIRYRVKFLPNLADPLNDILVDPLIFDDITIIYYSVPKFLSWAYRR